MDQVTNGDKQKPKAVIKTIYTLVNKKKMKDRTFTYAKIVKLIDLYKENKCLWDVSSPEFRRQERRETALSKIAKEFHITPMEVKKKIRSLRATYLLERRKVLASQKKVEEGLESYVYDPVLIWYKYMSFLNDVIIFRAPKATESATKLSERSDSRTQDEPENESHSENAEEVYYESDVSYFKREEVAMQAEYLDCDEIVDESGTIDTPNDPECFLDDDQQTSSKCNERGREDLAALEADRIRAETDYFRRKAEYIDVCIKKERKIQPLIIAKLKLEIENLTKRSP